MSTRYEIDDSGDRLVIRSPDGYSDILRCDQYLTHYERVAVGTIRQQAAEIAALVEALREARDCVLDCHNAEVMQRHSRAERAHYYAGLLAQIDAVLAKADA